MLIESITRIRAKRIKKTFNDIIYNICAQQVLRISSKILSSKKLGSKENQTLINVNLD